MKKDDCIFCKIVSIDIPTRKVSGDDDPLAFMDVRPSAKGHILVIPKLHYNHIADTPDDVPARLVKVVKRIAQGDETYAAAGIGSFNSQLNFL